MATIAKRIAIAAVMCAAVAGGPTGGPAAFAAAEEAPVVVNVDDGGFRWRDAGIGAVGALAVVLLVAGAVLTVRTRGGDDAGTQTEKMDRHIRRRLSARGGGHGGSAG